MFGHYNFINVLCAVCVGHYFKVNELDINSALSAYVPEMNRSQVVKTKTNSLILDAYNANPSSMHLAIDNFSKQSFHHKVVILGDMFELGEYSGTEHKNILMKCMKSNFDKTILVGVQFSNLKDEFPDYRFFLNTDELKNHLKSSEIVDSMVLIKGSRGMQLEKIVDYL